MKKETLSTKHSTTSPRKTFICNTATSELTDWIVSAFFVIFILLDKPSAQFVPVQLLSVLFFISVGLQIYFTCFKPQNVVANQSVRLLRPTLAFILILFSGAENHSIANIFLTSVFIFSSIFLAKTTKRTEPIIGISYIATLVVFFVLSKIYLSYFIIFGSSIGFSYLLKYVFFSTQSSLINSDTQKLGTDSQTDSNSSKPESDCDAAEILNLLNILPLLIFSINSDGLIQFWNKRNEKKLGYSAQEMMQEPDNLCKLFVDDNDYARMRKIITDPKPKLHYFESKLIDKSGKKRIISWKLLKIKDISNEKANWFVGMDITDNFETWIDLQKQKQQLNDIQTIAKIGTWEWNPKEKKIIWSDEMFRMLGFDKSLEQTNKFDLLKKATRKQEFIRIEQAIQKAIKTKKNINFQYKIQLPNGQKRNMLLQGSFILSSDEEIRRFRGTNQDITDIKRAEQKTRNILHASPDSIIVTDTNFTIEDYNSTALKTFGLNSVSTSHTKITDFIVGDLETELFANLIRIRERNSMMRNEEFVVRNTVGFNFFSEISAGIIGKFESPDAFVFLVKDITKRKIYEKALKEALEKAEESDRMKSAFLANMSHEIRTPMNAIIGFANLLGEIETTPEDRAEYVNYISSNSYILMRLINDIIDFSKMEANEISLKYSACSLNKLFSSVLAAVTEQQKLYEKENIKLCFKLDDSLNEKQFLLDEVRLKQVIVNLTNNALKFTKQGYVEFSCEYSKTKQLLIFKVVDTGKGIAQTDIGKIFDRFVKAENEDNEMYRGTGLGLSISDKLVKLMGGKITVKSKVGKGSEFSFSLKADMIKKTPSQIIPEKNATPQWADYTVLIAEDDEINFQFLKIALRKTKIQIAHAENGLEVLEYIQNNPNPDMILMDIGMPKMNGYEATEAVKKLHPKLPIVAQTAFAMADEQKKMKEAGCDAYLTKPVNKQKLINRMAQFLDKP